MSAALHVERTGRGAPVLLLHSSGLSGRQWRKLGGALAERGFQAVAVDFTGHGAAPALTEPEPLVFQDDVALLGALLAEGAPARLVGHSYGAFIALLATLAAPQSVLSLDLFEPVAFGTLDPVADADARTELAQVDFDWGTTTEDHERWLAMFVDYWGGAGAWKALREEARAEFRRVGWAVYRGVTSLVADETPASAYAAIGVPVRLLSGERSPLAARRVAQRLSESIPGATLTIIPGAGHMAPVSAQRADPSLDAARSRALSHGERVNAAILAGIGEAGGSGA